MDVLQSCADDKKRPETCQVKHIGMNTQIFRVDRMTHTESKESLSRLVERLSYKSDENMEFCSELGQNEIMICYSESCQSLFNRNPKQMEIPSFPR